MAFIWALHSITTFSVLFLFQKNSGSPGSNKAGGYGFFFLNGFFMKNVCL